ncbi:MAG: hypothetical protein ACYTFG_22000, partial [Planctomycetota bacterium]|jgi:hypothetical protein
MVDPSFSVEIVYTSSMPPVSSMESLDLKHPRLQDPKIKVGKVLWTIRAPKGYSYGISGDMDETEKQKIVQDRLQSQTEEVGLMIENLDKLTGQQQVRALENITRSLTSNSALLAQNKQKGEVDAGFAKQLKDQQREQTAMVTNKARGRVAQMNEEVLRAEKRNISMNAAKYAANQKGIRAEAWDVLEPERQHWKFGQELRGRSQEGPVQGGGFTPQPTLPPPSSVSGASMGVMFPFDPSRFRELHFVKEGKTAELTLRPWREGALNWLWTVVKFASIVLVFLAALLLGWLQEAQGWPYRRFWIWMVLLVVCGASLASWEFGAVMGLIAAFLVFRETTRIREEKEKLKRDYVV